MTKTRTLVCIGALAAGASLIALAQGRGGPQAAAGQTPQTPLSTPQNTIITLAPLYLILAAVWIVAWIMFWRQFRRRGSAANTDSANTDSANTNAAHIDSADKNFP